MRCYTISGLPLLLIGFCGCSQPGQPPTEFTQQIFQADRIVATNRYDATNFVLTGEEVGRVGKAVASAKHDKNHYQAIFDWDLQFYTGTNFLAVVHLQDAAFWIGGTQYIDETGVLKTFYHRLGRETGTR